MKSLFLALLLAPVFLPAQTSRPAPADVIITARRIYTAEAASPTATAVAIRGGRFVYVGTREGAMRYRGPRTTLANMGSAFVYPGLADAHGHISGLGSALERARFEGTRSYEEVIARVAQRAAAMPAGEWVLGRGWDQTRWAVQEFPDAAALSRAVPNHPVFIRRVDGHAVLANALAMERARVTAATPDPEGGRIVRDASGRPTGVFIDNAMDLISRAIPPTTPEQLERQLLAAVAEAHRWGLTSVHDAGESRRTIDMMQQLAGAGRFDLRTYIMVSDDSADVAHYLAQGPQSGLQDNRIWVRSIKLYADGALGSRGAALLAPYADDTSNTGLLVTPPAHIQDVVERALRGGFQVATHAIGDRGNRIALDAYEAALRSNPKRDHRFRVEHAQVVALSDIPRFARLGVIPSMQASHQRNDMRWAEARVGPERIRGAYAWNSFINSGTVVPNGSDFPVEPVNPLISFYSAVTRKDEQGNPPGGWYPSERMTRWEALKAMTSWPAFAGFQEALLGSIKVGKLADVTVLDRDIMTAPAESILTTGVVATYVGGREVYRRALRAPDGARIHPDPFNPPTLPFASDSGAVTSVVNRFHSALAAGDSTLALSLLDDDVTVLESGGVESRQEYRSHHLAADIAFARAVPSTRGPMRVRISGDVAWVSSTSVTEGQFNGRAINSASAELMVLRRTAAGWRISAIHWSSRNRRPSQ